MKRKQFENLDLSPRKIYTKKEIEDCMKKATQRNKDFKSGKLITPSVDI